MRPIEVLHLGSCLLNAPVSALLDEGLVRWSLDRASFERASDIERWSPERGGYRRSSAVYSVDEAIQLLGFLHGEIHIPKELRHLCDLESAWTWSPAWGEGLRSAEIVLLEIPYPVRISLDAVVLNPIELNVRIGDVLSARDPELKAVYKAWYYQGLMGCNEAVRIETGRRLADAVHDEVPHPDIARYVLLSARPHHLDATELAERVAIIQDRIKQPLAIVTHTRAYMPDGRPLAWPPELPEQTIAVANKLGIPVFEPSKVVKAYGAREALEDDLCHYRVQFWPALGSELLPFMRQVIGKTTSMGTATRASEPASLPD